jgi:RNA polymerase sigma factor (TIGR02999 family)
MEPSQTDVTLLLRRLGAGDHTAREPLVQLVYGELRKIAGARMRSERGDHTLQPTALVHEAYLRLVGQTRVQWRDRSHFFSVAAQTMRRLLVDHARARLTAKRGGGCAAVLSDDRLEDALPLEEILLVHDALDRLEQLDRQQAAVVQLHYFGGLTMQETADALGISRRTAHREWDLARAWLRRGFSAREDDS